MLAHPHVTHASRALAGAPIDSTLLRALALTASFTFVLVGYARGLVFDDLGYLYLLREHKDAPNIDVVSKQVDPNDNVVIRRQAS